MGVDLPGGVFRTCYSTSGGVASSTWVLQAQLPLLAVLNASAQISTAHPAVGTAGFAFNVTFAGADPSPYTALVLATPGNCSATIFAAAVASSTTLNLELADAGPLAVCYSTNGVAGPYTEQLGAGLSIVASATNRSIASVSPQIVVVGQPVLVAFPGVEASPFSVLSLNTESCDVENQEWVADAAPSLLVTVHNAGAYIVCYSTRGSGGFVQQGNLSLKAILPAAEGRISEVSPSRVPADYGVRLSLVAGQAIHAPSSVVAFARGGNSCAQVL